MEKEFVPYNESLALKELGFDELCICIYNREKSLRVNVFNNPNDRFKSVRLSYNNGKIPAPLYQQAFRWFKEKYKLMSCITPCSDGEYIFTLYDLNKCDLEVFVEDIEIMESEDSYEFFEEAELECLKKLIEIVKLSHKTATI